MIIEQHYSVDIDTNRSVAGVFGSDRWLALADSRIIRTTADIAVSQRIHHGSRRYAPCVVPARLAALRLRHVGPDRNMELLATATVQPIDGAEAQSLADSLRTAL